jgi:5-methyltetrahydropteroyltriglutamate--homocysteine methyltransferase
MVLPGPLTLARHSILDADTYSGEEQLAEDYTTALQQEIRALSDAGLEHLQIEEPSLLQTPDDAEWVLPLLDKLADAASEPTTRLMTYFGDATDLYGEFQSTGFDVLTFDFTYSDSLEETIVQQGTDKPLALGLLNGRNTKLRSIDDVTSVVENLEPQLVSDTNYLTFSCSIDYLPRDKARRKLQQLSEVRDRLTEGVAQV